MKAVTVLPWRPRWSWRQQIPSGAPGVADTAGGAGLEISQSAGDSDRLPESLGFLCRITVQS